MISVALLVVHIACGSVALLAAAVALATAKGRRNHILSGRVYALGMSGVFVTAVPLALLGADTFLLFIAFFSFYMVFAGWRFARNRRGQAQPLDWTAVAIMALTGLGMWVYGGVIGMGGDSRWVTLTLFGLIALGLAGADALFHRRYGRRAGPVPYHRRMSRHLTNMMAGTIATVTAVLVVNVATNPVWLAWILPTLVMTPLIVWWNVRVAREAARRSPG